MRNQPSAPPPGGSRCSEIPAEAGAALAAGTCDGKTTHNNTKHQPKHHKHKEKQHKTLFFKRHGITYFLTVLNEWYNLSFN